MNRQSKETTFIICPRCHQEVFKDAITCPFCNFGILTWLDGAIDENGIP
ncbi:hypothetical protein [Eubacterium ramulus]